MEHRKSTPPPTPRERAERQLLQYPNLSDDELAEMKHWFIKQASALDVGLIAGDDRLGAPYREFARDHLQHLTLKDYAVALAIILAVVALSAIIVWYSI